MAVVMVSDYPILVELIHNDVPVGTITDEWGTRNVYRYSSVHFLNRTGQTWNVLVSDTTGRSWTATINPGQEGTLSIPTPRRPVSEPFAFSLTFIEPV